MESSHLSRNRFSRSRRSPHTKAHAEPHTKQQPRPAELAATPDPADMPTDFASFELAPSILRAVREEGYETPSPIQARAIPPIMAGRDVLGSAQTGTGKTAAFALPVLDKLVREGVADDRSGAGARVLVLCPTRELAGQITDSFATYGRHTRLRHTAIYGGVSQRAQEKALRRGVHILVATPGRLIDLLDQGVLDLLDVETFILDEADRMLDMGFIHPIRRIAEGLHQDRQTLMFSATMPREILALAGSLQKDPVRIAASAVSSAAPKIEQSVYMVSRQLKQSLLHHLLTETGTEKTLVFTRTKHGADKVARRLARAGFASNAIHGNKSQGQRQRALDAFRNGACRVLVATDVAARGLDIDDVSHVFNFDLPVEPEAYVHRIGRTGRAGAAGVAIGFCDNDERTALRDIERLLGRRIDTVTELPAMAEVSEPREPRTQASARQEHRAPKTGAKPKRRRGPAGTPGGGAPGGGPRRNARGGSSRARPRS
jgi:ATP-dependent RNA helicase RhlE